MANGRAPSYPWEVVDSYTGTISSQLQKKRDLFGGYVIANYCPYDIDQGPSNPLNGIDYSFDWIGFNDYLNYLYQSDSYIDKGRLLEIIFLADSTGVNPLSGVDSQRQLINDYRHQNSDNLKDESKMNPFEYQSKAFKFDEASNEARDKFNETLSKIKISAGDEIEGHAKINADAKRFHTSEKIQSICSELFQDLNSIDSDPSSSSSSSLSSSSCTHTILNQMDIGVAKDVVEHVESIPYERFKTSINTEQKINEEENRNEKRKEHRKTTKQEQEDIQETMCLVKEQLQRILEDKDFNDEQKHLLGKPHNSNYNFNCNSNANTNTNCDSNSSQSIWLIVSYYKKRVKMKIINLKLL